MKKIILPILVLFCTLMPVTYAYRIHKNQLIVNALSIKPIAMYRDLLPPNPYCGKTPDDVNGFPTPPVCDVGYHIKLSGTCAKHCRDNFVNNSLAVYDFACNAYNDVVEDYNNTIDNYGEALQDCLNENQWDQAAQEQCWIDNNNQSLALYNSSMVQLDAIASFVADSLQQIRNEYNTCMLGCCEPIQEPRPIH